MGINHRNNATQKSKGYFVCDMSDLFGIGIPEEWTRRVLSVVRDCSEHRFYLLTKQPQNLVKWSPFPENCWVGVTATTQDMFERGIYHLRQIEASMKFMSFEPLLGRIASIDVGIRELSWLIIGQQTPVRKATTPKAQDIVEIVQAADQARVKVFLKDSLQSLLCGSALDGQASLDMGLLNWAGELRQEMPGQEP